MSDLRRAGFAWMVALAGLSSGSAFAATCTVTDSSDYNPITESVITGTLRWCVEHVGNNDSTATDVVFSLGSSPVQIDIEYMLEITESGTTITGPPHTGYGAVDPDDGGSYGVILDGATNGSDPLILISGADAVVQGLRIEDHQSGATPGPPPHAIQIAADGATIASNRIVNCSGGIAVFEHVEDSVIGGATAGAGNAIVGTTSEDGIILVEVGPGNALRHNRISGTYGSGIFVLESAVSMGAAALVDIDDNTISLAGGDGIVVLDSRVSLEDNTVDQSTGSGVVIADFAGVTDRMLVRDNTLTANGAEGIAVLGAEVSFWGNTVEGNGGMGVVLATSLGEDTSPGGTGPDDDTLAGGVIGSSSGADQNTIEDNLGGGLFILDATIDNIDDVETHNSFIDNGDLEVAQLWPALIQIHSIWDEPYEGALVEVWPFGGPEEEEAPLVEGETDADGYVVHDVSFDVDDGETWPLVPAFAVFDDGGLVRFTAAPHEVLIATGIDFSRSYPWDGTADGPGKGPSCGSTSNPCRYQRLDVHQNTECEPGDGGEVECEPRLVEGTSRAYFLCNKDVGPDRPLVIGVHGGGRNADVESLTRIGTCRMNALAYKHRFVTAYPQALVVEPNPPGGGVEYGWNDCRLDERDVENDPDEIDDVEFFRSMIVQIQDEEEQETDPDRTYVWGHSNGGTMVLRLATEFDPQATNPSYPRLTGVASNRGNEPQPTISEYNTGNECGAPASGADVLFMAGTADSTFMPFGGGAPLSDELRGSFRGADQSITVGGQSVPSTVGFWAGELGTSPDGAAPFAFHSDSTYVDNTTSQVSAYGTWDGPILRYYRDQGGGHTMAGARPEGADPADPNDFCDPVLFGRASADYYGIDEIWRFFQPRLLFENWDGYDPEEDEPPYGFDDFYSNDESLFAIVSEDARAASTTYGLEIGPLVEANGADKAFFYQDFQSSPIGSYRARFFLDASGLSLSTGTRVGILTGHNFSAAGNYLFSVAIKNVGTGAQDLKVVLRINSTNVPGGGVVESSPVGIPEGPVLLEVEWRANSAPSVADGFLALRRIDAAGSTPPSGLREVELAPVEWSHRSLEEVIFGCTGFSGWGSGTLYFDQFESYAP